MIRPERTDATPSGPSSPAGSYDPGGPVGRMQDDLARRLDRGVVRGMAVAHGPGIGGHGAGGQGADARGAGERVIHAASAASGYVALLAGYAGAFLLFWR